MVHFKCSWLLLFQGSLLFSGTPEGSLNFKDFICGLQSYNKYTALDLRTYIKQENMYHQMISICISTKES